MSTSPSLTHQSTQPKPPSRTVILGAGGFVGSHVVNRMNKISPVLALTRNEIDLLQSSSIQKLQSLLNPEDSLVVTSALAPCKNNSMFIDNIQMIHHLLLALEKKSLRHLVYVSSDAVYRDSMSPLHESSCAEPDSLHGVMHLSREVMLRNAISFPLAMVRPTLIYGPQDPHNGYGPNRFSRLALQNETISQPSHRDG